MSDSPISIDQSALETYTEPLLEMKAEDITVLDLRGIAEFADYFVICSGTSDVHVRAIADSVIDRSKKDNQRPLNTEGYDQRKWILIDFVDVVVHVMQPKDREFYGLEHLWGDAPVEEILDTQVGEPS
jgi:ribosome-associated protein